MLTIRSNFVLVTVLLGALAWPGPIHAQTGAPVSVEPPSGWFGVTISDHALLDERGNAFFDSYPVVTSVERGSPAARAGVVAGDVLVTFNSQDMRGGALQMSKRLRPGAPFVLELRRNDAIRVVRGTLGRPPEDWEKRMRVELSMPERFEMRTLSPAREPTSGGIVRVRMPAPPPSSVLLPALGFGGGMYPFAGAEFTALNDDLSDVLGVKPEGVFVTSVADGSPARISGLRGGDIIVKADSIKVETPIDLVRAIRGARPDRTISLQIIRKHRPQTITLRW
jgi:S1-C subfamily serine protease